MDLQEKLKLWIENATSIIDGQNIEIEEDDQKLKIKKFENVELWIGCKKSVGKFWRSNTS